MCLEIAACCCPPVAVAWKRGCAIEFWITLLLTLIAWLPGCCFACYVINQKDDPRANMTQVTNVQMAAAAPAPQNIIVNVQQQSTGQGPTPAGSPYLPHGPQYNQPGPMQPQYNQPAPMQPQYNQPAPMQPQYNQPAPMQPQYNQPAPMQPQNNQPPPMQIQCDIPGLMQPQAPYNPSAPFPPPAYSK